MRQEEPKKNYHAQQGFVLIIVVSILTIILALIAIGFSKLSSRELRQSSNRESAAQAYYAALSGINDATAYIKDGGTTFTDCNKWPPAPVDGSKYFTTTLSGGSNIAKYSCITVDSTPQYLENQQLTPSHPWIVKVDADNLKDLYIGWENSTYSGSPTGLGPPVGTLPQDGYYGASHPNATGVLRVGIYQVRRNDTSDDNNTLASNSSAFYLYPNDRGGVGLNSGTVPFNPLDYCVDKTVCGFGGPNPNPGSHNGEFVKGQCDINRLDPSGNGLNKNTYCNSEITGLDGSSRPTKGGNFYYLYITAQYAKQKVVIQGSTGGMGNPVQFVGGQSVIDVTGQAADQIQRVRAMVGLTPQFNTPSYAVQSMETLCKGFVLNILPSTQYGIGQAPGYGHDPTDCVLPSVGGTIGNPALDKLSGH